MIYKAQNYAARLFSHLHCPQVQYSLPQLLQVKNVICQPLSRIYSHKFKMQGGLYLSNGEYIPSSGLITNGKISVGSGQLQLPKCAPTLFGNSLYLGVCHTHFGHFLIETFSRLWFLNPEEIKGFDHIILLTFDPVIPVFITDLFKLLGVEQLLRVINESMFLENVCIPSPAIEYPLRVHQAVNKIHKLFSQEDDIEQTEQAVFLSRSQLVPGYTRVIIGEDTIEKSLQAQGVHIFHPQNHSIYEQINTLRHYRTIIGFAGSALHTLMLLGGGKKVIAYSDRKIPPIFSLLDRSLDNQGIYLQSKRKSLKGLATLSTGFKPQFIDPRIVLAELKHQGIITNDVLPKYGTIEADAKEVNRYNTALLLRWVVEASQRETEENCLAQIKLFKKNYQLDNNMVDRANQASEIIRHFFLV